MRHSGKKVARIFAAISIALTVMTGTAVTAYSSNDATGSTSEVGSTNTLLPAEDLTQTTTSLTVSLVYADEEQKMDIPVVGAVIDLYKVADLVIDNGSVTYALTEEFSSSGIVFEGMTASESLEASETLNSIIDANGCVLTASVTSDSQGTAKFSDLSPGMYLGRQREFVQISDTKKLTMEPVLWITPMYELNETQDMYTWNYSPTVYPKEGEIERIPTPTATQTPTPTATQTPTPTVKKPTVTPASTRSPSTPPSSSARTTSTTTSGTTSVKTGDTSPILILCVAAVAAIIVIIIVLRKQKK